MHVADGHAAQVSLPAQAASSRRIPASGSGRCWREARWNRWNRWNPGGRRARGFEKLRANVCVLRPSKEGNRKSRPEIHGVENKRGVGLRFVGSRHRIRKQTLILVYRAYIVPPRNAKRIKRRSTLRARVHKARDLGLVRIVQIRKRSTASDHAVRGKLIGDAHMPGIAETVRER